jgi:hypothetical protein
MNMHEPPPLLDDEERMLWVDADGFVRSLLRRISIARQERDMERGAVVAFLRGPFRTPSETPDLVLNDAADAIERGEHRR